jgi:Tol biopolymer transport system component
MKLHLGLAIAFVAVSTAWGQNLGIERVSFGQAIGANAAVEDVAISGDGRYVAFATAADNLVPGDTNGASDVFVLDRQTGDIERVSVASNGDEGNGASFGPSISDDGQLVAFVSAASNLVGGDTLGNDDIFVHDRDSGETTRVSVSSAGVQANGRSLNGMISGDGRYVAFAADATNLVTNDTNGFRDIFRHDRNTGATILISKDKNAEANNSSGPVGIAYGGVDISRSGKYVAYLSAASNLVNGDSNNAIDVFVVDADHPQLKAWRASVISGGGQGEGGEGCAWCAISPDGNFVAFASTFDNLVDSDTNGVMDVFRYQRDTQKTVRVSVGPDRVEANDASTACAISDLGKFVAFSSRASNLVSDDTNGAADVFVHEVAKKTTRRVSIASDGTEGNALSSFSAISDDGQTAAFVSLASNLVVPDNNGVADAFVHLPNGGVTARASELPAAEGNGESDNAQLSADGNRVLFTSAADNLVEGDTGGWQDVFMLDRPSGELRRISVSGAGAEGNGDSWAKALSADGNCAVFISNATNLVADDTNGNSDVFLYDWDNRTVERVSLAHDGAQGNGDCEVAALSADGQFAVFATNSTNLVAGGTVGYQVFLRDRDVATTELISRSTGGVAGNDQSGNPTISADGQLVAFFSYADNLVPGDTNGAEDIFLRRRDTGTTERVSLTPLGAEANSGSYSPSISADGLFVAFSSDATNLEGPGNDTLGFRDIFVRDLTNAITERMRTDGGAEPDGDGNDPQISANGRCVVYSSAATNLIDGDSNGFADVFVCDRLTAHTRRLSVSTFGAAANSGCIVPAISGDGTLVAFASRASTLVDGDTNAASDVFLARDTGSGVTVGQTFQLNAGDVVGLDENFVKKPKVAGAYTDPVKLLPKRKTAKVWTALFPEDVLRCEWKGKIALFNKKLVPKTSTCKQYFGNNPIAALNCELLVGATKADGTKLVDATVPPGAFVIPPPDITGVYGGPGGMDGTIASAGLEDTVVLRGAFFGNKKPKVWLEYYKKGVVKAKKLAVQLPLRFRDIKGVADKSCMDVDTGASEVTVLMPSTWPTGWDHNVSHNLVIDNGLGRDTWPFRTNPPLGPL